MFGLSSDSDTSAPTYGDLSSQKNPKDLSNVSENGEQAKEVSAFIGEGVEFKGVINYEGTVRIDGRLEGEIYTKGVLLVGSGAVINAKVEAGVVVCQGQIIGDIVALERVQLLCPARLDGSVRTPSLSMEEGVLFNGSCEMGVQVQCDDELQISSYEDNLKVV